MCIRDRLGIAKADATVENIEAAAILIISGAYIGFLPEHFAEQWVKTGEMRRLGASTLDLSSPFEVVTRRGVSRPPILQAFLEDLAACTSQPGVP